MTLEEAIKHCREKKEELVKESTEKDTYADLLRGTGKAKVKLQAAECRACAKEHEQLATWLEELEEWHKRVEVSKNGGRCSIIIEGKPLYITEGHIEALKEYEQKQMVKDVVKRLTESFKADHNIKLTFEEAENE